MNDQIVGSSIIDGCRTVKRGAGDDIVDWYRTGLQELSQSVQDRSKWKQMTRQTPTGVQPNINDDDYVNAVHLMQL